MEQAQRRECVSNLRTSLGNSMQARTNGLLFEAAALLDGTRGVVRLHSNRLEWKSDGAAAASVQLEVAHVASFQQSKAGMPNPKLKVTATPAAGGVSFVFDMTEEDPTSTAERDRLRDTLKAQMVAVGLVFAVAGAADEDEAVEGEANHERRTKERTYTLDDVQRALRIMFARSKLTGKKVSPAHAARDAGHPQMAWKVRKMAGHLGKLPDDAAQSAYIDGLTEEDVFPAKGPKPRGTSVPTVLTDVEDLLIKCCCDWAADGGFPLRRTHVRDLMVAIVTEKRRERPDGRLFVVSDSFVKKWMRRNRVAKFKTSSIALARAEKATPELRDEWFGKIRKYVAQLGRDLSIPYKSIDEWPNVDRFTMDEDGVNTTKHRDPALCSINKHADQMHRLFDVGLEKMGTHASDVMVTRADGAIMTSTLIKERGAAKKRKKGERLQLYAPSAYDWLGLRDEGAPDGQTLKIGLAITPSGSMVVELFERWCEHFVAECLEPGQGTCERPVLLFLDGHASRWTVAGLAYLRENHV